MIEFRGITKIYNKGKENEVRALDGIDLNIKKRRNGSHYWTLRSGKIDSASFVGMH